MRSPFLIAMGSLPPFLLGVYVRSVLQMAVIARRQREGAVREARAAERVASPETCMTLWPITWPRGGPPSCMAMRDWKGLKSDT